MLHRQPGLIPAIDKSDVQYSNGFSPSHYKVVIKKCSRERENYLRFHAVIKKNSSHTIDGQTRFVSARNSKKHLIEIKYVLYLTIDFGSAIEFFKWQRTPLYKPT